MGEYELQRVVKMECAKCGFYWRAGLQDKDTEHVECPECGAWNQVPPKGEEQ